MSGGPGIVVVGGGIAGITCAALAARRSDRVALVEAAPRLGGLLGSLEHDGRWFDHGTHVPQRTGCDPLDDLLFDGISDGWRPLPRLRAGNVFRSRLNELTPFPDLHALGPELHDRAVVELLDRVDASDPAEHPSAADRLRARFGPTVLDELFEPLLLKLFGLPASELGPTAGDFLVTRVTALTAQATAELKAVPYVDAKLGFHRFDQGPPGRLGYYPTDGGAGRWIEGLEDRHLRDRVDVRAGCAIEEIVLDGDRVVALRLADGSRLEVGELLWTAPIAGFLRAAGLPMPAGGPPRFLRTDLHHLVLDRPFLTDLHYVTVLDPDLRTFRITLYPNLRGDATDASCTVEVMSPPEQAGGTSAEELRDELVRIGVADPEARLTATYLDVIPSGFPVPTPAFAAANEEAARTARASASNTAFLGRSAGQAFFLADVLVECYRHLSGPDAGQDR